MDEVRDGGGPQSVVEAVPREVKEMMPAIAEATKAAVLDDFSRNRATARAAEPRRGGGMDEKDLERLTLAIAGLLIVSGLMVGLCIAAARP